MQDRTIVITGATSGIGEVAAIRLAEQGARIVFIARDQARAEVTLAALRKANRAADHRFVVADLSLLSDMKRAAGEIEVLAPAIAVLINNAGALFNKRQETADGLEKTFALNHMSYFTITNLLLPKLKPGARIVSTASRAHEGATLDFDDLQSHKFKLGFQVYAKSKLCNILFTRELARRIAGTGVTVTCLHPGFVSTRFGDQSGGFMQKLVGLAKALGAISPEEGAKTIVYLAASLDVELVSGEYFDKCKIKTPSKEARNDADAKRLWEISAKIAGVG